jgi:hypothetical protein
MPKAGEKADRIASSMRRALFEPQSEEERKRSEFLERLGEYRSTLDRYIKDLPGILIASGVSDSESQAIMTTLRAEQFEACQDLVEEAYGRRIKAREKDDPPNIHLSRLESMAEQIGLIAQHKEGLNKELSILYPEGD